MVNNSLGRLGDSLLRERIMQQEQQQQQAANDFRNRQLDIDQSRYNDQNAIRQNVLKNEQVQQGLQQLQKAYSQISTDYSNGVIDKDEANRRARAIVDNIKKAPDLMLQNSPFAAMLDKDGDLFSDKPAKPAPTLTPVNTPGFKGALTPGGAYVTPDAERPNEFDRMDYAALGKQLEAARDAEAQAQRAVDSFVLTGDNQDDLIKKKAALLQARTARMAIEKKRNAIRNGGRGAAAAAGTNGADADIIQQAKDAISRGADPAAVAARLKQKYGLDLQ